MLAENTVRDMLQAAATANPAAPAFYSIWNKALDEDSELTFPCVVWMKPTSTMFRDKDMNWKWRMFIAFEVRDQTPADRRPDQRDDAYERASHIAREIVMKFSSDYEGSSKSFRNEALDLTLGDVQVGTEYDQGTDQWTGVFAMMSITDNLARC